MKKKPAKKKASTQAKPKAARDYFPPVAPDDPIYQSGYVVDGRYPACPYRDLKASYAQT
jgi:hypothetical protein